MRATAKAAAPRRRSSWDARTPRSRASCRTRWPAIRRLNQVVTRTVEGGDARHARRLAWYAGVFRAENRDDILFVTSEQTGFGYFRNFGKTRRQGLELGAREPSRDA